MAKAVKKTASKKSATKKAELKVVDDKKSTEKTSAKSKAKSTKATKTDKNVTTRRKSKIEVGSIVEFQGYTNVEDNDDTLFEVGDTLYVVATDKDEDGVDCFVCILADHKDDYDNDHESVSGEQLYANEIALPKGKSVAKKEESSELKLVGELPKLLKDADPLEVADNLYSSIQKDYLYLGGVLLYIHTNRLHEAAGYDTSTGWADYLSEKFNMKIRSAEYRMKMYKTISAIPNITKEQIDRFISIGMSKAKEIERFILEDGSNFDELVSVGESHTMRELPEVLKKEYVSEGKTPSGRQGTRQSTGVHRTTYTFKCYEAVAEFINYVLEENMKQKGLASLDESFADIVSTYGFDHLSDKKRKKLEKLVAKAEKEAVDSDEKEAA